MDTSVKEKREEIRVQTAKVINYNPGVALELVQYVTLATGFSPGLSSPGKVRKTLFISSTPSVIVWQFAVTCGFLAHALSQDLAGVHSCLNKVFLPSLIEAVRLILMKEVTCVS